MSASELALIPFVSVQDTLRLILEIGVEDCIAEIETNLDEDFRRWPQFDKTPRVASHSHEEVIELMPTSDGVEYGFKYVNGHPKNMSPDFRRVLAAFPEMPPVSPVPSATCFRESVLPIRLRPDFSVIRHDRVGASNPAGRVDTVLCCGHPGCGASGACECWQTDLKTWAESPFR